MSTSSLPKLEPSSGRSVEADKIHGGINMLEALQTDFDTQFNRSGEKIKDLSIQLQTIANNYSNDRTLNNRENELNIPYYKNMIYEIQAKSIDISRKVQSISLRQQQAINIDTPKKVRPINEDFANLKIDFDGSMKNIAILALKLKKDSTRMENILQPYKKIVIEQNSDIDNSKILYNESKNQFKRIAALRDSLISKIHEEYLITTKKFTSKIVEIEDEIEKLQKATSESADKIAAGVDRGKEEDLALRGAIAEIGSAIYKDVAARVSALDRRIDQIRDKFDSAAARANDSLAEALASLSAERARAAGCDPEAALEAAELEGLLERLRRLEAALAEGAPKAGGDEVFFGEEGGRRVMFVCHADGTFDTKEAPKGPGVGGDEEGTGARVEGEGEREGAGGEEEGDEAGEREREGEREDARAGVEGEREGEGAGYEREGEEAGDEGEGEGARVEGEGDADEREGAGADGEEAGVEEEGEVEGARGKEAMEESGNEADEGGEAEAKSGSNVPKKQNSINDGACGEPTEEAKEAEEEKHPESTKEGQNG